MNGILGKKWEPKKISIALGIILIILSLFTRFWNLSEPRQVVFDEVHFGKFVTAYCCTGKRFFDIHPPHAKLIIAGTAKLFGYAGEFPFLGIGDSYGTVNPWPLRAAPALAGSLFPFIIFLILRQLGASRAMSFFAGMLILLDSAEVIQSRVIALDSILLVATFGSLASFLAARSRKGWPRYAFFILAGALAGLAVGTKFTGLAALALIGMFVIYYLIRAKDNSERLEWFWGGVLILVAGFIVYASGWLLHYSLLTLPGEGDAWQIPSQNVVADIMAMHKIMLNANYNLTATHPYMSPWWTWPGMRRPVFYWQSQGAYMYFIGNPAVWWGASIVFLSGIAGYALSFIHRKKVEHWESIVILLAGFGIAFMPLIRVPRALFLYHYLTPLVFSLMLAAFWLDKEVLAEKTKEKRQIFYIAAFLVVLALFILFSPFVYGFKISESWYALLYWFPTWR